MYRSAARIGYVSPSAGDLLARRGVPTDKLVHLPMWADETARARPGDLRAELGLRTDQLVCVYAGALGEAQGLDSLIEACARVDDPRFVCRMPALMATGDVHYVSLRPGGMSAYTMPSKVPAILAAGRAILVAVDGDAARVAHDSGAGITARPGDPDSIAAALREACDLGRDKLDLLGQAARGYYDRVFSLAAGAERIERALGEAVTAHGGRLLRR